MLRAVKLISALVLAAGAAQASPFWVTWDQGWPDQQGWTEGWSIPAQKWLDGSLLYIDSTANGGYDGYYQEPATLMPGAGETFQMCWRIRVDESTPTSDPGVRAEDEDHYTVDFSMDTQSIHSNYESDKWATFAPGVFHDFLVESTDMRAYRLYIDGALALEGNFSESLFPGPYVDWGDMSSGRSLADWDSVQYGIVPEPSGLACVLVCLCCARMHRRPVARTLDLNGKGKSHEGQKCSFDRARTDSDRTIGARAQ
jgi:hypothetical protein